CALPASATPQLQLARGRRVSSVATPAPCSIPSRPASTAAPRGRSVSVLLVPSSAVAWGRLHTVLCHPPAWVTALDHVPWWPLGIATTPWGPSQSTDGMRPEDRWDRWRHLSGAMLSPTGATVKATKWPSCEGMPRELSEGQP